MRRDDPRQLVTGASAASGAVWAVVAVFTAATAYEAMVALRVIEMGSHPGEGPPGGETVGAVAALGFLAAMLVSAWLIRAGGAAPASSALLAPAAAAFLLARFYTFDSYYLPTLVRYSERDFIPPAVVFILVALSVGAGMVAFQRRSLGLALSTVAIVISALTAWFSGVGH